MRKHSAQLEAQFTAFYDAEADAVFRYCLVRTSDREVSLDLVSGIFMRYFDALVKGDVRGNERAFLFTIARNLLIDWYRKKKSLSLDAIVEEGEMEMDFPMEGTTQEDLERSADARLLVETIQKLEPSYRQVVYLRFVEDLKPSEIAGVVGESVNIVSVRITRGVDKLRVLLKEKEGDNEI